VLEHCPSLAFEPELGWNVYIHSPLLLRSLNLAGILQWALLFILASGRSCDILTSNSCVSQILITKLFMLPKHKYVYIYIYVHINIHIYVCVCVCVKLVLFL
jgi:hypothetical protein